MPLPATPWIRAYDNPELYLGGYRSGLEQQQIRQRGALAAAELGQRSQEMAGRMQMAQMEMQTRLEAEQHRRAIESEQLAMQKRLDDVKIDQAARQAAAEMRIQARLKAGEDEMKVYREEGVSVGSEFGPSGLAALQRAKMAATPLQQKWMPADKTTGEPGRYVDQYGNITFPTGQGTSSQAKLPAGYAEEIKNIDVQLKDLYIERQAANKKGDAKEVERLNAQINPLEQRRHQLTGVQEAGGGGAVGSYQMVNGQLIFVPAEGAGGASSLLQGAGLGFAPNIYGGGQMMPGPGAYVPPELMPK